MHGANDQFDPITDGLPEDQGGPLRMSREGDAYMGQIPLPPGARALPVLGPNAALTIMVGDRASGQGMV